MKTLLVIVSLVLLYSAVVVAQNTPAPPYTGSYYKNVNTTLNGRPFEKELMKLISTNIRRLSYDQLWDAFNVTDTHWASCPGKIHDIYSTKCWNYGSQQCGNYKTEGDCYNREHSWPKSWWGGESANDYAYTDLHHLFPSDGYDNNIRSNYPFGEIIPGTETYTTNNGCKLGTCAGGYKYQDLTCWEPADEMKGDLARGYFYMSARYLEEFTCCELDGVNDSHLRQWMEKTLRQWNKFDPVSIDEATRNNYIYDDFQYNRNPFIDHPEWVSKIYNF